MAHGSLIFGVVNQCCLNGLFNRCWYLWLQDEIVSQEIPSHISVVAYIDSEVFNISVV